MATLYKIKAFKPYFGRRELFVTLILLFALLWSTLSRYLCGKIITVSLVKAPKDVQEHFPLAPCSKPALDSSAKYLIVKKLVSFFEERNIEYIVYAGTFLQLYRDCDISNDSSDIDFAIPLDKITASLKDDVVKELGFSFLSKFGIEGEKGHEISFKTADSTKVDIFSLNCNKDGFCWTPLWVNNALFRCGLYFIFPTAKLTIGNDQISIPRYPSTFLEQLYGSNWTIPISQSNWDWKSPFCRAPVAV